MKTITLLTDFGLQDNYVGVMKGVILKINPRVNIIDLSHNIAPQDILSAAFLLRNSFKYFARNSIFLVVVDPGVGTRREPIIIRTKNYRFIGPDNGVLSLAAGEDKIKQITTIENKKYILPYLSDTFHGRDIFAPASGFLSKGVNITSFGKKITKIKNISIPKVKITKNILRGEIIYIDRFGNLVTNIDRDTFGKFIARHKFNIKVKNCRIPNLSKSYQQVKVGRPLSIIGSSGCLEISVNNKNACDYFRINKGEEIRINRVPLKRKR